MDVSTLLKMDRFASVFCVGLDQILMEFLLTEDALQLCRALFFDCPMTAERFQKIMYRVCLATSWDYPQLGSFFLHHNIELHHSKMQYVPEQCPFWIFQKVKVNMFGCRINLQGVYQFMRALPRWQVNFLEIGSDFSLPIQWPRNLQKLHIRFCPRTLNLIDCPESVRELVVYSYSQNCLKIRNIPLSLNVLDIDDHCIAWPNGLASCNATFLRLRLWARHQIRHLPCTLQSLVLVIKQKCNVQVVLDLVQRSQIEQFTLYSFVNMPLLTLCCPMSMTHCSVYFKMDNCLRLSPNQALINLSERVCLHPM